MLRSCFDRQRLKIGFLYDWGDQISGARSKSEVFFADTRRLMLRTTPVRPELVEGLMCFDKLSTNGLCSARTGAVRNIS